MQCMCNMSHSCIPSMKTRCTILHQHLDHNDWIYKNMRKFRTHMKLTCRLTSWFTSSGNVRKQFSRRSKTVSSARSPNAPPASSDRNRFRRTSSSSLRKTRQRMNTPEGTAFRSHSLSRNSGSGVSRAKHICRSSRALCFSARRLSDEGIMAFSFAPDAGSPPTTRTSGFVIRQPIHSAAQYIYMGSGKSVWIPERSLSK